MAQKYFAKKVRTDLGEFDSTKEYHRYQELLLELKAGIISCLHRQTRFEILPQITYERIKKLKTKVKVETLVDEKAKHYKPDFVYYDNEQQCYIMEEVKSYATEKARDYSLRRHLIKLKIQAHNRKRPFGQWKFKEIK